jgi:hypothetical protein
MTLPAEILIGEVNSRGTNSLPEDDGEILFEKPRGLARSGDHAEAVLVVLEPDQNPREVAELILWALRSVGWTETPVFSRRTQKYPSFKKVYRASLSY